MPSFKTMNDNLKPREKLKHTDINNLSDAELLAIIIGSGTKESDVMQTAHTLLMECNGLNQMQSCTLEQFKEMHGIGEAKASILFTIFEISKRANKQKFYLDKLQLNKPEKVEELCNDMKDYNQEKVVVLCLNIRMELISRTEVYVGEIASVTIEPREIFKTVFLKSAYGFILVHNHPSGYSEPSEDDYTSTKAIIRCAKQLNVLFVDHIVIARDGYSSIRALKGDIF